MSSQVRHAQRAVAHTEIDRTVCPRWQRGERKPVHHGTESAARRGCLCQDAIRDRARRRKHRQAGIAAPVLVSNVGSSRRVQALLCIGWRCQDIATELGTDRSLISRILRGCDGRRHVTRDTADRIARLYERWSMTVGPSSSGAKRALNRGFLPPLAWDDIDLDDTPAASEEEVVVESTVKYGDFDRLGKTLKTDTDPDVNAADALFYRRIAWDQMSPVDREYAVWRLFERWSVGDIAQAVGVNKKRVERAIRAARERWRQDEDQTAA